MENTYAEIQEQVSSELMLGRATSAVALFVPHMVYSSTTFTVCITVLYYSARATDLVQPEAHTAKIM